MEKKKKTEPTPSQKAAIRSRKKRVLVTASAGAGKTSTMISRVLSLLLDDKVRLSDVVMLTFTNTAAAEMRTRLSAKIFDKFADTDYPPTPEERVLLAHAVDDLPLFRCGTIDSFCFRLVQSHFGTLGLSPMIALLDEKDGEQYVARAMRDLLDEFYRNDPKGYLDLINEFDDKRDDLIDKIKAIYDFAETTEDGDRFLEEADRIAAGDPERSPAMRDFFARVAAEAQKTLDEILDISLPADVAKKGEAKRNELLGALRIYSGEDTLDQYAKAGSVNLKGGPNAAEFALIKKKYEAFRDELSQDKITETSVAEAKKVIARSNELTRTLIALAKRFKELYAALKEKDHLLDFSDAEHYALTLLRDHGVSTEIACRYLLVDECQDLNPLQDTLMRLLLGKGDLFMVGDVKQSIFRFRLSDPQIFRDRVDRGRKDEENAQVIDFVENFRSSDAVVDYVNTVFSKLMTEEFGGIAYPAATRGDYRKGSGAVRCFFYEKPAALSEEATGIYSVPDAASRRSAAASNCPEGEWVRDRILELVGTEYESTDRNEEKPQKLTYKHFAILSPKKIKTDNLQERVIETLRKAGIPVNIGNFVKDREYPEIMAIVDFLRLIESPMNDYALLSVLRSDMYGYSATRIAEISLEEGKSFSEKAMKAAEKDPALAELFAYLDKMRRLSGVLPLYRLVSRLIEEKLRFPILKRVDGRKVFGEILTFAETLRSGVATGSISEYLPFFDKYYSVKEGGEVAEADAVNVMTIHASKGLEFPVVFVIGLDEAIIGQMDESDPLRIDKDYGVVKKPKGVKQSIYFEQFKRKKYQELREDKLRLLYVALTRARNYLFLSGAASPADAILPKEKAKKMSDWLIEAMRDTTYSFESAYGSSEVVAGKDEELSEDRPLAHKVMVDTLRNAFKESDRLKNAPEIRIKNTVTAINQKEEVQSERPRVSVLFPEDAKAKGTAFHAVMEHIPLEIDDEKAVCDFLEKLVTDGVIEREDLSELSPATVLGAVRGVRDLVGDGKVYREKSFLISLPASEVYEGVELKDQVLVQGKIDLVALRDGKAIVLDYKLSRRSADELIDSYSKQLELYAKAVKQGFDVKDVDRYIFVLGRNEKVDLEKPENK